MSLIRLMLRGAVIVTALAPCSAAAQDSVRVLRFGPGASATAADPVIVTFDHPIAPKLGESVDPSRAIRIAPDMPARKYWRDPSTLVVEFDSLWRPGSSYTATLDTSLRSAGGLPLSRSAISWRMTVPRARVLATFAAKNGGVADTIPRPVAIYNQPVQLEELAAVAALRPVGNCSAEPPMKLRPLIVRPIDGSDNWNVREAGGYERDRRADSLRRVVEFIAPHSLPRGCSAWLTITLLDSTGKQVEHLITVREPFQVARISCPGLKAYVCGVGSLALVFNEPVSAGEVKAHVRVNGEPAQLPNTTVVGEAWQIWPRLGPRSNYVVTVDSSLRSTEGERLRGNARFAVTVAPPQPGLGYPVGSYVVPDAEPTLLRIRHVNVDTVIVIAKHVADSMCARALAHGGSAWWRPDAAWRSLARDSIVLRYAVHAPRDEEGVLSVPVSDLPKGWWDGSLVAIRANLVATPETAIYQEQRKLVSEPAFDIVAPYVVLRRSALALHVDGADGDARVWLTTIGGARPVSGAQVRVLSTQGRELARGTTGAEGRVRIVYDATWETTDHSVLLEARHAGDLARHLLADQYAPYAVSGRRGDDELSSAARYSDRRDLSTWHGTAFADRGIYRPGQQVFLKGTVRRFVATDGYSIPSGDSARWVVRRDDRSGDAERIWTHATRLNAWGSAVDTFPVPRTARLGAYSAMLSIRERGRWRFAAEVNFSVAEYRVPEFTVTLSADTLTPYFAGDTANVLIESRYLYGLPMSGATAQWWADTREDDAWNVQLRGLAGMAVGRPWWFFRDVKPVAGQSSPSLHLDSAGHVIGRVPIGPLTRPGRVHVSASVTDVNRQAIVHEFSIPAHPADVYVGARFGKARWWWNTGDTIALRLLVVDASGVRRAGVAVRGLVLRYRYENGWKVADTVWRGVRTSTTDTLVLDVTVDQPGLHEIVLRARDARGREAATGLVVWVQSKTMAREPHRQDFQVTADKPRYRSGERAQILVVSPFAGPALVTLSREGVLWQKIVPLVTGSNAVPVLIPSAAIPSAEIAVVALNAAATVDSTAARTPTPDESNQSPFYRRGQVTVQVARDVDELRVTVNPDRTRYQPRDSVRLQMTVRDAAGRPVRGEIAAWAVDQGVASLTDLAKPDLLTSLLLSRGDPFSFSTTLASLLPPLTPGVNWFGAAVRIRGAVTGLPVQMELSQVVVTAATAAAGGVPLRQFFSTTPFFRGVIPTDRHGNATARFALPDNLTTFRIFAAAIDGGVRAGSADTSVVSTRTLAVRPSLPRIVRAGDTLLAGAVLTQDRAGSSPVTLRVEGRGVQLSSTTVTDTLVGRRARELRFGIHGISGDTVRLRFAAATSRDADAVEARLPVSPNGHTRAHVAMGTVAASAFAAFSLDEPLDTLRSRLEVQVGSSPLPLLQRLSESLRLYPYDCTEQLASIGRGIITRIRAERLLDPTSRVAEPDRLQLEAAVAAIVERQRDDGAFGYWSATNWTTPWLTAYALGFLNDAQTIGVDIPPGAFDRARSYLGDGGPLGSRRRFGNSLADWDTPARSHDALTAALVLRSLERPDSALERRVLQLRDEFDWTDRLLLAQLLAIRGDTTGARQIVSAAWRSTRVEGRRITIEDSVAPRHWMFRSILRPTATLLRTAAALTPTDGRLDALLESLIQVGRSERQWTWNTIDQTLAAEAVLAMLERPGARDTTLVTLTGLGASVVHDRTVVASASRSDTIRAALPDFLVHRARGDSVALRLTATSPTPVYYAATLFEVPTARPVRADDGGIFVERWYERFDDPRPVVSVREGELVRVRIRVTVPADREFVAIEDPLPAGLEAVDLSLRTSGSLPPFAGAPHLRAAENAEGPPGQRWLYGSWDAGWWTPWEHREIRDDRVLYFARQLWAGSYLVSYVARATTAGTFVRPPAHAEEMYNPAVHGRSDGGTFTVEALKR
ncbi:MAG TPA: MG2 domain-containing protein [Gemmatimonadaceae bacterium]